MRKREEFIKGQQIGSCEFIQDADYIKDPKSGKLRRKAKFKCICGNEFITFINNVKRGNTTSCGCYNKKRVKEISTRHGLAKHPLYGQWQNIKNRCNNPNVTGYEYYGGKGIKV